MNFDYRTVLVGLAFLLAVIGLIKPSWPLANVAVLLLCIYLLVSKS